MYRLSGLRTAECDGQVNLGTKQNISIYKIEVGARPLATHIILQAIHHNTRRGAFLVGAVGPDTVTAVGEAIRRHKNSQRSQRFGRSRGWALRLAMAGRRQT